MNKTTERYIWMMAENSIRSLNNFAGILESLQDEGHDVKEWMLDNFVQSLERTLADIRETIDRAKQTKPCKGYPA